MKKLMLMVLTAMLLPWASAQGAGNRILFLPHDDRPISYHQTVEVVEGAGYEMLLPPKEMLSNATNMGHPEELWQWLRENAPAAKSAVISSDSLLYGGPFRHQAADGHDPRRDHRLLDPGAGRHAPLCQTHRENQRYPSMDIADFFTLCSCCQIPISILCMIVVSLSISS